MIQFLQDALPIIRNAAPLIASALGSPGAGVMVSLLANAFNPDDPKNPKSLVDKILSSSDAEDKLRKLQDDHSIWLDFLVNMRHPSKVEASINVEWPNQ